MAKCEDCKGEGYKDRTVCERGYILESLKVRCETCKGMREIPYEYSGPHYTGKRSGIAWERE